MPQLIIKLVFSVLTIFVLSAQPAIAVKIVRLDLQYGSDTVIATGGFDIPQTNKTLYLELFDNVDGLELKLFDGISSAPAPFATVSNFLDYVNDGRYDDSFFTRSVSGFVLQAGGATNKPADPDNDNVVTAVVPVAKFPSVVNEPGISSIRGTLAMARLGGKPDSATKEWFINLGDNSSILNPVDGGFTVFGRIIDDGMETVDEVALFPSTGILSFFLGGKVPGTDFNDLPVADADLSNTGELYRSNLFLILTAREMTRPILRFLPAVSNFGFASTDSVTTGNLVDVVLKNTGNEVLDIAPINTASLDTAFSVLSENCSNTSLVPISVDPTSSCTASMRFLPTSTGRFTDNLAVSYTGQVSGDSFSVKHPLIGEGGIPIIEISNTLEISSQIGGFSTTRDIIIGNAGQASLQILAISGLDLTDFSQTNNCIGDDIFIAPDETCAISVNFMTSDTDTKIAMISIESNDPITATVDISLTGTGDSDADGVVSAIEDAAPNAGDYNIDGNADSVQNDVASFTSKTGDYISLVVDSNNVVSNISMLADNQLTDLPTDVEFKHGVLEYEVFIDPAEAADASPFGVVIDIFLILPSDAGLESYYFFGETEENATPHWYQYIGVRVFGNAELTGKNGDRIKRNFIRVQVQDGGLGDADQVVNGRVLLAPGAPAYGLGSSNSSSSAINILFLGFFTLILIVFKRKYC